MRSDNKNGAQWYWHLNIDKDSFDLVLNQDIIFATQYKPSDLLLNKMGPYPFSANDAAIYSQFREQFSALNLEQQPAFTLAINACVALQYLKPQPAKSWLFELNSQNLKQNIQTGTVVILKAINKASYIVLESDHTASNVMLIDNSHQLDGNRCISQGRTIRVHNDRLLVTP